jgi:adenosylhomocysteine nucleosidase
MNRAAAAGSVIVTFALPDESRAFTRRLQQRRVVRSGGHLPLVLGECGGRPVAVVHTGIGDSDGCRQRLEFALRGAGGLIDGPPALVISSGYAGALQPGLAVGDLILGENFSAPSAAADAARLLSDWRLHPGLLTTQPRVAETAAAKSRLGAETGALAVDMETAWIAAACARAGVPALALRVISDASGQAFPAPGDILFDLARQRPRYVALPLWLLAHPAKIRPFARFVRGLGPAQDNLARALEHLLASLVLPLPSGQFSAMNDAPP